MICPSYLLLYNKLCPNLRDLEQRIVLVHLTILQVRNLDRAQLGDPDAFHDVD